MTFAGDQLLQSVDHVNALKRKNFLRAPVPISSSEAERSIGNKAVFPMSSPRIQANPQSSLPFSEEAKPGFRTKTVATRLTPDDLAEIEAVAERTGQALSEWLRGTALRAARQRPAD